MASLSGACLSLAASSLTLAYSFRASRSSSTLLRMSSLAWSRHQAAESVRSAFTTGASDSAADRSYGTVRCERGGLKRTSYKEKEKTNTEISSYLTLRTSARRRHSAASLASSALNTGAMHSAADRSKHVAFSTCRLQIFQPWPLLHCGTWPQDQRA